MVENWVDGISWFSAADFPSMLTASFPCILMWDGTDKTRGVTFFSCKKYTSFLITCGIGWFWYSYFYSNLALGKSVTKKSYSWISFAFSSAFSTSKSLHCRHFLYLPIYRIPAVLWFGRIPLILLFLKRWCCFDICLEIPWKSVSYILDSLYLGPDFGLEKIYNSRSER